jgi:hypothetical protein
MKIKIERKVNDETLEVYSEICVEPSLFENEISDKWSTFRKQLGLKGFHCQIGYPPYTKNVSVKEEDKWKWEVENIYKEVLEIYKHKNSSLWK